MRRIPTLLVCASALVTAPAIVAQQASVDPTCVPVVKAMTSMWRTNRYRISTTITGTGKPMAQEQIFINDTLYQSSQGLFIKTGGTGAERIIADLGHGLSKCKVVGSGVVTGEAATIWVVHTTDEDSHVESEYHLWISNKSGLSIRGDADLPNAGIAAAHMQMLMTYGNGVQMRANAR